MKIPQGVKRGDSVDADGFKGIVLELVEAIPQGALTPDCGKPGVLVYWLITDDQSADVYHNVLPPKTIQQHYSENKLALDMAGTQWIAYS